MDIEENEEIEKEIDIVFSGQFINDVKIFQFPLIPKNNLNIENINSLSSNKDAKLMKIDMNIDPKYQDKNNYNAEPIQSMIGEKIESNANLCIGTMKNGKLYITPISQIYQFRHDFSNIEKDNNLTQLNKKKDKKDIKNSAAIKKENTPISYDPLNIHQSNSINSKIILEKISSPEGFLQQADFMNKNEYFDLLLKYVIAPETNIESDNDYIPSYKNLINNYNESNKLEKISEENDMEVEEEINTSNNKKSNVKKTGLQNILNSLNDKKADEGVVENNIINIFGDKECLYYNNLLGHLCDKLNIKRDDLANFNMLKDEINKSCVIINNNYCFIKNKIDCDVNNVRLLLIENVGNAANGLKKQQIKKLLEQNQLNIPDAKLNKVLKNLCEYSGSSWVIKPPMNV